MTVFGFEVASHSGWTGRGVDRPIAVFSRGRLAVAVRTSIGFVAAVGVLALPWLGRAISPSFSAWNLTLSLGAVPLVGHLSYGLVLAALTGCAFVSFARAGWQRTVVTRAVGWSYLLLALFFVVSTRLSGEATLFALQSDASRRRFSIANSSPTTARHPQPSSSA